MARILIVEDEEDLSGLLDYNLRSLGHETEVARTGAAAVSRVRANPPDLVLLDLMLPDIAGTDVARMIRSEQPSARIPIIMVTAKGEEGDRVRGLELGADDYVVKPFSVQELLLRVAAVLRRMEPPASGASTAPSGGETQLLSAGNIQLDIERHEVLAFGQPVVLTALEFRLLKTFLERPGRVQTRETLLSDVWGIDAEITTRTVDTHI
jgi:two-component system phosphate regulon response regulator PhoB